MMNFAAMQKLTSEQLIASAHYIMREMAVRHDLEIGLASEESK